MKSTISLIMAFVIAAIILTFTGCPISHVKSSDDGDKSPPSAGNGGTLTFSNVTSTSLSLNWTKASDKVTAQENLLYIVYMSTSDDIGTVADCEKNGTALNSYTADIGSLPITGLTASTSYYFNVVVKNEAGNKSVYAASSQSTAEGTAPKVSAGILTFSSVLSTSLTVGWTKATDNASLQGDLEYLLYYSASGNIGSVSSCETNGTAVGYYSADIDTKSVTGLSNYSTYYFNVIVKDEAGNKTSYAMNSQSTTDGIAPVAGNSGIITFSYVADTALTPVWTAATDKVTAQTSLQYMVYRSASNNIGTVANCEANGTALNSYATNISSYAVTGLTSGSTYYFNVVVKDAAGNKSCYASVSKTTPPQPAVRWRFENNGNDSAGSKNLTAYGTGYSSTVKKDGSYSGNISADSSYFLCSGYTVNTNAITVSAWVYVDSATPSDVYWTLFSFNSKSVGFDYDSGYLGASCGDTYVLDPVYISNNTWVHIILTFDGSNVKLYHNGSLYNTGTTSLSINATSSIIIGFGMSGWKGCIDDMQIFNRAITAAEAAAIYQAY
jgi:hypothetical protein